MPEFDKYLKQPLGKKRINNYDPCENADVSTKMVEIDRPFEAAYCWRSRTVSAGNSVPSLGMPPHCHDHSSCIAAAMKGV